MKDKQSPFVPEAGIWIGNVLITMCTITTKQNTYKARVCPRQSILTEGGGELAPIVR